MRVTNFEPMSFSMQMELRNKHNDIITEELRKAIAAKVPYSLKHSISANDEKVTFYSKSICCGHNSFSVVRKGKYLIAVKEISNSNKTEFKIAEIIERAV